MILLSSILSEHRIVSDLEISSKKKLLEFIAETFSTELNLNKKSLFNLFFEREELSSTGIGNGFALPHARTSGIDNAYGCLLNLQSAIPFDAIDSQPIDLVFALLVPEHACDDHLKVLASIAQIFSDTEFCNKIRDSKNPHQILNHIMLSERVA